MKEGLSFEFPDLVKHRRTVVNELNRRQQSEDYMGFTYGCNNSDLRNN